MAAPSRRRITRKIQSRKNRTRTNRRPKTKKGYKCKKMTDKIHRLLTSIL